MYIADSRAFVCLGSKARLRRPKLDNRHFGLVHTAVSYTWPELTTLVDIQYSHHKLLGAHKTRSSNSTIVVLKNVARSLNYHC